MLIDTLKELITALQEDLRKLMDHSVDVGNSLASHDTEVAARDARIRVLEDDAEALRARLAQARKSAETLRRIEELEASVASLQRVVNERDTQLLRFAEAIKSNDRAITDASTFNEAMARIAERLGVGRHGRSAVALVSAIEDAIRKLK